MYKLKQSLKLLLLVVCLGAVGSVSAQMSGTYTIDNTAATGAGNFANWQDFRNSIVTNGVNGAVVVNVKTDITETAQITFPPITGVSSTNTVTINGNGKFVAYAIADAVILINGADFFTFDKLIVRNTTTSQYAQGYRFTYGASDSKGSDYNTISNGTIEFSAMATATTAGGAYISFSSTATSVTATNSLPYGSFNTISGNMMRTTNSNSPGPSYGITCSGSSSTYSSTDQGNTIIGNTIENFYYMAMRLYYTNGIQVTKNDISRKNATSANCNSTLYGIYSYYAYSTSRSTKLDENNLHDWPFVGSTPGGSQNTTYAFYTYQNQGLNNTTNRFSISNNTIKNLTSYYNHYNGYNYYGYYMDITGNVADNNDVSSGNGSAYHYGWNVYYALAYKIDNNTIKNCDGSYYWRGIYVYSPQNSSGVSTSISGNTLDNNLSAGYIFQGIQAMYIYNGNSNFLNVNDNIITRNQSYGYYMVPICIGDPVYYGYPGYGYVNIQRNKIIANKSASNQGYVFALTAYYNYDQNITDNLIADNVGYYGQYAIYTNAYNSGTYKATYRQNTIRIDGSQSGYGSQFVYALYAYMYYHSSIIIEGNITDLKNLYYAYVIYTYNTNSANIKIDRNSYFINSVSNQYFYTPVGSSNSFTAWNSSGAAGSNEKYGDPKWNNAATYDYRSNTLINQNNIPYNTLDIKDANQVLRNTAKNDRGALEGYLDIASVSSTFAPNSNECAGYLNGPTVTLKNNFIDAVTGFSLGMSVNGVLVSSALVTNTIAVGATGTVSFNPVKFSKAGVQKVKIFLLDADDNATNDTLTYSFNIKQAPGGSSLTFNTTKSAAKAVFDITGKPDITTNGQAIVYDFGPPTRVGFVNTDHLFNGGSKWIATVSGATKYGIAIPGSMLTYSNPSGATNAYITFNPTTSFVDSLVTICIKVSDLTTGCDTTYCRKVLVAPQGVPDFKLPSIICDKDDIFFENTSAVSSGALLSTWDFGDGSPTVDATSPVYKYNGPGTYQVKLTVVTSPFGYVTSITKTINVNEIPTASFKNTNACEGNAVTMINTTTIGSGTLSYVWDFGDGSPTATTTNASRTYAAAGGYKVTLKASGNGCTNVFSKNVYEFARPVAAFIAVSGSCENDLFTFKNNSSISQGEFGSNWDFDDGGNFATVDNPQYDFLTPGVKNVKLLAVSEFGCTNSVTVPVTVKAIPATNFTFPSACSIDPTQFNNTTVIPAGETSKSYTWDFGDGYSSTATSPLKQWLSIGPKIVKLTAELNNGCIAEKSQIVNVGVQPKVDFQFADQCAGSEVQFTNLTNFTQGKVTYDWDFGDNATSNGVSPRHTYTTGIGTQSFTVKLKATIKDGCSDSFVQVVNINPLPTTCNFDIVRDYSTSLTAYKFTPTGGALAGISYTWLTGDGNTVATSAAGTSYSYAGTGKYCVTMISRNTSGCECSSTKCITLATDTKDATSMNNLITIFPNPTNGVFNVKLDAYVDNNMVVEIYNSVGEVVKTVTVNSNNADIDLSMYANGVYMVKVIADNQVATKAIVLNK